MHLDRHPPAPPAQDPGAPLIETAYRGLRPLADRLAARDAALAERSGGGGSGLSGEARRLRRSMRAFEPAVTLVGQVKAGKTTLVNAMTGMPGLLPADVNPWTSVVTSLHLTPRPGAQDGRACFRFFDEAEWDHLLNRGGRVGELASRAGAADELDKVRAQLKALREKARARLGRRFEMLLGQTHEYDRFDQSLIERYVCLGDDLWETGGAAASADQGRFADITRSADLWIARPELPLPLCLRDTPGVNDTFMIREQITLNALRGSRLCVLVLSAAQAMSAVDLALLRMISNIKSRDVVIFVNRIDELDDPARAVPEIRQSIRDTLKRHDGPAEAQILFGSALWATRALEGRIESLPPDAAQRLLAWAEAGEVHDAPQGDLAAYVWHLSGLPALGDALSERIAAGPGATLESQLDAAQSNLDQGAVTGAAIAAGARPRLPRGEVEAEVDALARSAQARLGEALAGLQDRFRERVEKSRATFLSRATAALVTHLETHGEQQVWTYDPGGLRMLLRSAHRAHVTEAQKIGEEALGEAARQLGALYARVFALDEGVAPAPPPLPEPPPPVTLGQTIALDLRGAWWSRFWRRARGYKAFADDFAALIQQETAPMVEALRRDCAEAQATALQETLAEFLRTQRTLLLDLTARGTTDLSEAELRSGPTRPVRRRPRPGRPGRPQPV